MSTDFILIEPRGAITPREEPKPRQVFGDGQWSAEDEEMLRRIFAIFFSLLWMLLRREDIEDLAQETLLKVFIRTRGGCPFRNITSWCRKIAVHKALNLLARGDARVVSLEGIDEALIVARHSSTPTYDEDECAAVRRAVARLPERDRLTITYRYLEGNSLQQTALLMGAASSNPKLVSHHVARALSCLRKRLTGESSGRQPGKWKHPENSASARPVRRS